MVKVSGVPYDVDLAGMYENNASPTNDIEQMQSIVESLQQENKMLKATIKALKEECNWLEAKTREVKQSTQGEH